MRKREKTHRRSLFEVEQSRNGCKVTITCLPFATSVSRVKAGRFTKKEIAELSRILFKESVPEVARADRCIECRRRLTAQPDEPRGMSWASIYKAYDGVSFRCLYCKQVYCADCAEVHFMPIGPCDRRPGHLRAKPPRRRA